MSTFNYNDAGAAIDDLEKRFPVPRNHFKKGKRQKDTDLEIQRSKEFHVLIRFLKTNDPLIKYPIEIEHCGDRERFPDFIFTSTVIRHFIEISEITDRDSQLIYQSRKNVSNLGIIGTVDLTPHIKSRVDAKNDKINQYRNETGILNSILLLYHNHWPPFSYGSPGDELRLNEIQSSFNYTFLFVPVYGEQASYLKI